MFHIGVGIGQDHSIHERGQQLGDKSIKTVSSSNGILKTVLILHVIFTCMFVFWLQQLLLTPHLEEGPGSNPLRPVAFLHKL